MKKILPLFSYILHPIFIPVIATLYYLFSNNSYFINREKAVVFIQVMIITVLVPSLFFLILRYTGKIKSIMAFEISERKIPLVIQIFLLILLVRNSITVDRYPELHFFFLGALLSTIIALFLLFAKTKASIHMIAISALTVFVIGLSIHNHTQNIFSIAFLILMNGFVASSRLEMKAHTTMELIIGFVLGVSPQILLLYLWL
ncbi:hypothetical protein [Flavobacterium sp. K5-23]|uniref:hypothetical protein n=1 Tax=Flavobacterium sp. K5-23 TaxID=2746225 RepID=UPI00200EE612|nr:hypothetical protein [Flavobacterium sp. K5-23]UQD55782.1 hypothetical protein FLAK523_04970 [Flavobacterium sp. K5-23]